jgi:hypothetical protein
MKSVALVPMYEAQRLVQNSVINDTYVFTNY